MKQACQIRDYNLKPLTNGWKSQEQVIAILLVVGRKAFEILSTIPYDKQKDYKTVFSALEIRLGTNYFKI